MSTTYNVSPAIELSSEIALLDQDTTIIINNLIPHETILVRAEATDDNNIRWLSFASFQADSSGTVDLSAQSPLEGTYSGIDPMGLFWSMESEMGPSATFTIKNDSIINLKVFRKNQEIASKKIVRLNKSPDVQRIPICENGLVGVLFLPPSEKPLPVIITLT